MKIWGNGENFCSGFEVFSLKINLTHFTLVFPSLISLCRGLEQNRTLFRQRNSVVAAITLTISAQRRKIRKVENVNGSLYYSFPDLNCCSLSTIYRMKVKVQREWLPWPYTNNADCMLEIGGSWRQSRVYMCTHVHGYFQAKSSKW